MRKDLEEVDVCSCYSGVDSGVCAAAVSPAPSASSPAAVSGHTHTHTQRTEDRAEADVLMANPSSFKHTLLLI